MLKIITITLCLAIVFVLALLSILSTFHFFLELEYCLSIASFMFSITFSALTILIKSELNQL